jgi:SAM-dependent methyltransferase
MLCPVCESDSRRLFQKYNHWIRECLDCYHRFCEANFGHDHVQKVYSDSYFFEGGDGYPDYLGEKDLLIAHGARYGRILSQYMEPGRVLDVGAAAGFILKGLQSTGWTGAGIEPNARMAEHARQEQGVPVQVGTLEQFETDQPFDLITMIQVVAHFHDIRAAFQRAADATKPGGYWLIESWNKDSWLARSFGENWHEYSPPSVLRWFGTNCLNRLAADYGLTPVASGRPEKWLNMAHIESLLSYKMSHPAMKRLLAGTFRWIPDKLAVPYPTFDLFWTLYRKAD